MDNSWLHNLSNEESILLLNNLHSSSIDDILSNYHIHDTPGINGISYKIFISDKDGFVFEFKDNKIYSYIPSLVVEDYDKALFPPPNNTTMVFKKQGKLYVINKYIAIL